MIFTQLLEDKYSFYLEHTEDGLVCYEEETPDDVIKEFKNINNEYRKIFGKDFIKIIKEG